MRFSLKNCVFIVGFAIGVALAFLLKREAVFSKGVCSSFKEELSTYDQWFSRKGLSRRLVNYDELVYGKRKGQTEASYLEKKIPIVCVVFVQRLKNAQAIQNTWGKHCSSVEFIGTPNMPKADNISVPLVKFKPRNAFHLLCDTINYMLEKHKTDPWFLFVYDYMFIVVENLRHFLAPFDHNIAHYFGHPYTFWGQIYNVAESGYVLSNAAMHSIHKIFNSTDKCQEGGKYWKNEDFYLGKHLWIMGIAPVDTRDHIKDRFHADSLLRLIPGLHDKLISTSKKSVFPVAKGLNCCSEKTIAFHGVAADKLYFFEYFIQRLKVFSRPGYLGNLPPSSNESDDQVWIESLKSFGIQKINISSDDYFSFWKDKLSPPDVFNERIRQEFTKAD